MAQPFFPNQDPQEQPASSPESFEEENRKAISRRRVFWTIVIFDIVIAIILTYEIVSLFIG